MTNDETNSKGGSLHVHRLKGMRLHSALGFRLFGVRARRWFREHRMEVVHSLTVACPGDVYQAYAGVYAAMQAQAAASRHTDAAAAWKRVLLRLPGKQRTLVALEKKALLGRRAVRRVIGACGMMAREVAAFYPGAAGKVVVMEMPRVGGAMGNGKWELGNGGSADPAQRELRGWFRGHYGIGDRERVAVFVGHDFRRKGLRYAIEAVARTKGGAGGWRLLVVGQGRVREYVELAEELGVGMRADDAAMSGDGQWAGFAGRQDAGGTRARVMFLGPTGEMGAVYAAADALLLPTFYEPSGLVAMEALGAGLPVVSTVHLGISEVVREKRVGVIVDSPRDVAELARALEELPAEGTGEWEALRERCRTAGAGVSGEAYVAGLERVYGEVKSAKFKS